MFPPVDPNATPQAPQPTTQTPTGFVPQQSPPPQAPANYAPSAQVSTFHQNVERSGFDDAVKTGDFDSYKGGKNRTDRIGFLTPRDIVWGRVHYVQDKGFFMCDSRFEKAGGQEIPKHLGHCCQKLGMPKKRFAALLVQYATDQTGRLIEPFGYALKVWRYNEILFDQIRTINREMPMEQHDLFATCTDDTYWKYNLTPCKESLVHSEGFRKAVDAATGQTYGAIVDAFIASMSQRLDRTVGKANEPREWAEILGMPASGGLGNMPSFGAPAQAGDQPIDSIAQLLRGGTK